MTKTNEVTFFFDPSCPWSWMTSRWITEVKSLRDDVSVRFVIMSLAVLNEGRELDEWYRDHIAQTWVTARATALVALRYNDEMVERFYTALGGRIHPGGQPVGVEVVRDALADLGLDAEIAEIANDPARAADAGADDYLRSRVAEAQELVGTDVGVPTIAYQGRAMFGPVMSPAPHGDQALDVFDGLLKLMSYPGFYEVKRSRDVDPIFD